MTTNKAPPNDHNADRTIWCRGNIVKVRGYCVGGARAVCAATSQTLYGFSSGLTGSDDAGSLSSPRATRACSLGAASCEHGNRYDGEGLSFFKNSSGRNSNIWIYNCLNLIDLSLKNVLLRARSWWTGRKRRRPEDEGAPVVHVFQGEGRRRLKRTEDRHRWLYFSCAPDGMASSFFRRRTQTEPATSGVWVVYPGAQRLSQIT